jgi:hypothetical protein
MSSEFVDGVPIGIQPLRSVDTDDTATPVAPPTIPSAGFVPAAKADEEASPPVVIHFEAILKGLTIGSSLLPSLRAQYKVGLYSVNAAKFNGEKGYFL